MVTRRELFVEGGGDRNPSLASECRRAFSKLFDRAGVANRPRVIACGGRGAAYEQFRHAHESSEADVWLLVDAEELPTTGSPWEHVRKRHGDAWARPAGASDEQLHLMTVCMETWLAADPDALRAVFGPKLEADKLPPLKQLESTEKPAIFRALDAAIRRTRSGKMTHFEDLKGSHSFRVLENVSPDRLRDLSWGRRFLDAMATTP